MKVKPQSREEVDFVRLALDRIGAILDNADDKLRNGKIADYEACMCVILTELERTATTLERNV